VVKEHDYQANSDRYLVARGPEIINGVEQNVVVVASANESVARSVAVAMNAHYFPQG
jgi:hypothetical protein